MEEIAHLKISLQEIILATNNFSNSKSIGRGGFGNVYLAELSMHGHRTTVAIKQLDRTSKQGKHEFLAEVHILSCYRHKNIISLLGFCDDGDEKALVYEYAKNGSLDKYLNSTELSWMQRLQISIGAARGLKYLHNDVGPQHRVLHRDIKSSNILLDENWEAKISDFGLSKIGHSNVEFTYVVTKPCGTAGYIDPQYYRTGILTKESDVYSFGVVLFEILCGELAHKKDKAGLLLSSLAKKHYEQNRLVEMIHPSIKNQIKAESLDMFAMIAYQCLKDNTLERPTMAWIVDKLEKTLELQAGNNIARYIRLGIGGGNHNWSFQLRHDHHFSKISIDHGDAISTLTFTSENNGVLRTLSKVGGLANGNILSEVLFDGDEEITGIHGSIDTQNSDIVISSLSFQTTKMVHGPFGQPTMNTFSIPWDNGSLMGFYGLSSKYIESIGVYVKPYEEIIRVGTWGRTVPGELWSFQLQKDHHLKKITVEHGDLIYSLMFTSEYRGSLYTSDRAGGWNGGDKLYEVTFDWDEEIVAINGTVDVSRGDDPSHTIISSISFVTNKRTHGHFGDVRGTPFLIHWDNASFAGFYGICGWYIDSIGVYLKATT